MIQSVVMDTSAFANLCRGHPGVLSAFDAVPFDAADGGPWEGEARTYLVGSQFLGTTAPLTPPP